MGQETELEFLRKRIEQLSKRVGTLEESLAPLLASRERTLEGFARQAEKMRLQGQKGFKAVEKILKSNNFSRKLKAKEIRRQMKYPLSVRRVQQLARAVRRANATSPVNY